MEAGLEALTEDLSPFYSHLKRAKLLLAEVVELLAQLELPSQHFKEQCLAELVMDAVVVPWALKQVRVAMDLIQLLVSVVEIQEPKQVH